MRTYLDNELLPEDDESLLAEIEYAKRTGHVIPYAGPRVDDGTRPLLIGPMAQAQA